LTQSKQVRAILERLLDVGYVTLRTPLRVASVDFEFTAALGGPQYRSLELVIVVDGATGAHGDTDATAVRSRIEALSRALDVTNSRYTLTVVIAGAAHAADITLLAETCRVLTVPAIGLDENSKPFSDLDAELLDDQIRLLLPLMISAASVGPEVSTQSSIDDLVEALPDGLDAVLVQDVIKASLRGDRAVTSALANRVDDVLGDEEEIW
jgi:hypothetical protein